MNVDFLKDRYGMQLLFFLMITLASYMIFGLLATSFITFYYEVDALNIENFVATNLTANYILLVTQQIGFFLLPALVFAGTVSENRLNYLKINFDVKTKFWASVVLFAVAIISVMGFLSEINNLVTLPELAGKMEKSASEMTNLILTNRGIPSLLLNILVIGLLPAIGEELFFRGVLQKIFTKQLNSAHLSIFVTGFLFSFIHLQFYTFLPRFFTGIMLGYLLYWSRSIIIPIIAHFFNNLLGILAFYYWGSDANETGQTSLYLLIPSILILIGLSYWYANDRRTSTL